MSSMKPSHYTHLSLTHQAGLTLNKYQHEKLQTENPTHSANGLFSFSTNSILLQSRSGICINKNQFITVKHGQNKKQWCDIWSNFFWTKPLKLVLWNHLDQIWLIWNRSSVNLWFFWKGKLTFINTASQKRKVENEGTNDEIHERILCSKQKIFKTDDQTTCLNLLLHTFGFKHHCADENCSLLRLLRNPSLDTHRQILPVLFVPWTADDVMRGVLLKIIFL